MPDLAGLTVDAYLAALGGPTPAPGGGSAAALAAAAAAGLVAMVAGLTAASPRYAPVRSEMEQIAASAGQWQARLTAAIDEDATAFTAVMRAYRLPRAAPAEIEARRCAVQSALARAAAVPLSVAEACLALLPLAQAAAERGLRTAVSDAAAAAHLAHAAAEISLRNLRSNVAGLEDRDLAARLAARADEISAALGPLVAAVLATADARS